MFDLKSYKVLGRIPAAEDADAIIYDAPSNRVFTFNGDAHSSTVIDPVAGTRIANVPLGGKPEYGASAGDGKIYANLTDTSEVVEIEGKTATVTRRWSTAPCKQPVAMAIDVGHHRLFSVCRSGVLAVSDYPAGKVVATLPIAAASTAPATMRRRETFASNADVDGHASGRSGSVRGSAPCNAARFATWDSIRSRIAPSPPRIGPPPGGAAVARSCRTRLP
jgi:hypothetical protein